MGGDSSSLKSSRQDGEGYKKGVGGGEGRRIPCCSLVVQHFHFIWCSRCELHRAEKLLLRTKTMTTFSSSSIFICIKQKPKVPRDEARAANFSQSLSRTLRQSKAHYSAAPEAAAAAAEEFFAWQPAKDCSVQLFPSTAATPTLHNSFPAAAPSIPDAR